MQVLAYNSVDDSYFIGLSVEEFETLAKKFIIHYEHNSNFEVEKQKALYQISNLARQQIIKELYNIDRIPFICAVVSNDLSLQILPPHYPFGTLWNGYSPWKSIQIYEIKSLSELKKDSI